MLFIDDKEFSRYRNIKPVNSILKLRYCRGISTNNSITTYITSIALCTSRVEEKPWLNSKTLTCSELIQCPDMVINQRLSTGNI